MQIFCFRSRLFAMRKGTTDRHLRGPKKAEAYLFGKCAPATASSMLLCCMTMPIPLLQECFLARFNGAYDGILAFIVQCIALVKGCGKSIFSL